MAVDANLFHELFEKGWLVKHEEIYQDDEKINLLPEQIPLISYPYEWSFSQYKHLHNLRCCTNVPAGRVHAQRRWRAFNITTAVIYRHVEYRTVYTEMNPGEFYIPRCILLVLLLQKYVLLKKNISI
jgi:hypothetical protein